MEKKASESFHEYAHKWKDLAAQVQPPMTDKELNKMFLNTLKAPYYDRMIGNSNKDFSDVVSAGEMIEVGVKQSKIEAKKPTLKKKEGETCGDIPRESLQSLVPTTTNLWLSAL